MSQGRQNRKSVLFAANEKDTKEDAVLSEESLTTARVRASKKGCRQHIEVV